ncbi:myb-like protein X isoform X1 [Vespa velutina]|uniref:myb-like protein X isoform X1 n=2 Tax=Vespa velutina TaxID=202808 RepID=UPI001FB1AE15|nr:myb-like protein X isoform X1 [Vespa velutina]
MGDMWLRRETNSIFYVDSDYESIGLTNSKMETEVRTLKEELAHTQETLKAATKRCRDLVRELDNRTALYESERTLRDQQLSRILRALLILEARLKQEQKSIRQVLCEKDNVIRNQQLEIARLRRYTKNYIKSKREQILGRTSGIKVNIGPNVDKSSSLEKTEKLENEIDSRQDDDDLSKEIENLKCEIITKLDSSEVIPVALENLDRGIKKTYSFAGSDVSKTSMTSSENTDVSIVTTTTEGSPSLISTEGFCEGESTDVSPGSTLNKSNRCTPTTVTDSENETTMIFDEDNNELDDDEREDEDDEYNDNINDDKERETLLVGEVAFSSTKRKTSLGRSKSQKVSMKGSIVGTNIIRTESKDDGMDCNFVSEDEEKEQEPIYVNSFNENNAKNLEHSNGRVVPEISQDYTNNNNDTSIEAETTDEQNTEETSGNWYSDPDEDKTNDDVFRHTSYRSNSNHNSVLECVNQILLRDMEDEDRVLSVPRRFKHRGRTVRFQPARLSDIESVGSEMERKNSEEGLMEKETLSGDFSDQRSMNVASFEATASEDEYGMRITHPVDPNEVVNSTVESVLEDEEPKVIPIVIIEPKVEPEEIKNSGLASSTQKPKIPIQSVSPPLRMERIEEKTCLQMSTKRLTIAKNLDYEDIESLPEVILPSPKTPPALPPKPQFRNNTLILKKIPSPSFLIDETRKKLSEVSSAAAHGKKIFTLIGSPIESSSTITKTSVKNLNFDETSTKNVGNNEDGNFWKNRFNNVRSSFQSRHSNEKNVVHRSRKIPRVTNIVRHFEEFKIGGENEERSKERNKPKERYVRTEFGQEFDIRQNFEEFNLDECDLSDDPNRPEADGSERLSNNHLVVPVSQNETNNALTKDNNNHLTTATNNANTGYDNFLEATGLSNKSILTPSRLLSNHKSMLKPKDVKYKNKIKATAILEKHNASTYNTTTTTTMTTMTTTTTTTAMVTATATATATSTSTATTTTPTTTTHVRHWTGPFV